MSAEARGIWIFAAFTGTDRGGGTAGCGAACTGHCPETKDAEGLPRSDFDIAGSQGIMASQIRWIWKAAP